MDKVQTILHVIKILGVIKDLEEIIQVLENGIKLQKSEEQNRKDLYLLCHTYIKLYTEYYSKNENLK